jgi:hypothetical protein
VLIRGGSEVKIEKGIEVHMLSDKTNDSNDTYDFYGQESGTSPSSIPNKSIPSKLTLASKASITGSSLSNSNDSSKTFAAGENETISLTTVDSTDSSKAGGENGSGGWTDAGTFYKFTYTPPAQ